MKTSLIASLAMVLALAACQTNPITGRKQLMLVSEDSAIAASKEAYVAMLQPLEKSGKVNNDPAETARIERITGLLVAQAIKFRPETKDWEWSIKVIDDPKTVNAWAMAGGKMAIYTGVDRPAQGDRRRTRASARTRDFTRACKTHRRTDVAGHGNGSRIGRGLPPRHRTASTAASR